jgi:septal ring factor EnvC (AmiA/AmiB activator)
LRIWWFWEKEVRSVATKFLPAFFLLFLALLHQGTEEIENLLFIVFFLLAFAMDPSGQQIVKLLNEIKEKLATLSERVHALEGQMGNMESRIGNLESRMGNLESRMGNLESRMGNLESRMNSLEKSEQVRCPYFLFKVNVCFFFLLNIPRF